MFVTLWCLGVAVLVIFGTWAYNAIDRKHWRDANREACAQMLWSTPGWTCRCGMHRRPQK